MHHVIRYTIIRHDCCSWTTCCALILVWCSVETWKLPTHCDVQEYSGNATDGECRNVYCVGNICGDGGLRVSCCGSKMTNDKMTNWPPSTAYFFTSCMGFWGYSYRHRPTLGCVQNVWKASLKGYSPILASDVLYCKQLYIAMSLRICLLIKIHAIILYELKGLSSARQRGHSAQISTLNFN